MKGKSKIKKISQRRLNFLSRSLFLINDATFILNNVPEGIILISEIMVEISASNFGNVTQNTNNNEKKAHKMTQLNKYLNICCVFYPI